MLGFIAVLYVSFGWAPLGKFLWDAATAAWVQAVGSVAAIAAAVWIGRRTERQAQDGAKAHAIAFKDSLVAALLQARNVRTNAYIYAVHEACASITAAAEIGAGVRLDLLDAESVVKIARMRTLAVMARSRAEMYLGLMPLSPHQTGQLADAMNGFLHAFLETDGQIPQHGEPPAEYFANDYS